MKILILGAGGMLGHKMYQTLSNHKKNVTAVFRKNQQHYKAFNIFDPASTIDNLDVTDKSNFIQMLNKEKPDVILNCIGKTTRKINQNEVDSVIYLNSYLPQTIANWSSKNNSYFIHFSTDCVFSGKNGPYRVNDFRDSRDIYGLSKILGETQSQHGLTIRTSIVGREIENKTEFFEWIFSMKGQSASGYKNVFYSGVTTLYLSQLVNKILTTSNKHTGLLQVGSEPISKFDLIKKVNSLFQLNIKLQANFKKVSNKTLSSIDFQLKTKIKQPTWDEMLLDFKNDNVYYEHLMLSGEKAS